MDNHSYDDIINLPHPTSRNHPRMSLHDRAAQFAPFAALTGHDAAIKETARLTDERLELSDEVIMKLNDQLNMIRDNIGTEQEVSITYFVPDDKKSGGAYLTHSGIVKKIDEFERKLIMQDKQLSRLNKSARYREKCSEDYMSHSLERANNGNKTKNIILKENIRGTNGRGTSAFNDAANQYIG